jgi:hypothetical protein
MELSEGCRHKNRLDSFTHNVCCQAIKELRLVLYGYYRWLCKLADCHRPLWVIENFDPVLDPHRPLQGSSGLTYHTSLRLSSHKLGRLISRHNRHSYGPFPGFWTLT